MTSIMTELKSSLGGIWKKMLTLPTEWIPLIRTILRMMTYSKKITKNVALEMGQEFVPSHLTFYINTSFLLTIN